MYNKAIVAGLAFAATIANVVAGEEVLGDGAVQSLASVIIALLGTFGVYQVRNRT